MDVLTNLIEDLESKIDSKDSINTRVSERDVSWHIAHSLKVLHNVMTVIQKSNPQDYRWKFNRTRSIVYLINKIPRGKGKAPKAVIPEDEISMEQLRDELQTVRQLATALENLHAKSNFTHPLFGQLNLKQTKKFLAIHTKHHLKIIDDIIRS